MGIPHNLPLGLYAYWGTKAAWAAAGYRGNLAAYLKVPIFYLLTNSLTFLHSPTSVSPYPNAQTLLVQLNYTANVTGNGDYSTADGDQIVMLCQRTQNLVLAADQTRSSLLLLLTSLLMSANARVVMYQATWWI